MKRIFAIVASVAVVLACTAFAPPRSFALASLPSSAADSVRFGAICQVDEPAVSCQMALTDSTHNAAIGTIVVVAGDTLKFAVPCVVPLETVVVRGEARGVNRSGTVSTASISARGTGVCGDQAPGAPRSFIIFTTG